MSVHWADPPPIGGPQDPRAKYVELLRPLLSQVGRWAVIKSGTPSAMNQTAMCLRNRTWHVPPGRWEFTVRTFRRGVHVGDLNVAQIYARYLGPGNNGYMVSDEAVFDEDGHRVCEECGARLSLHPNGGKWPRKCDLCWAKANPKWLRRRTRLRAQRRNQRAAGTYVDPRKRDGWRLAGSAADRYMVDVMGIPPEEVYGE